MSSIISCPPLGSLPIEWEGLELDSGGALQASVKRIEEIWPNVWPSIYKALWSEVQEYEHEEYFNPASKRLVVRVPDFEESEDAEWHISVHLDFFAGVYEVEMQGHAVIGAGVSF